MRRCAMVTSRIWFTAAQKAELWERWKNGQSAAAIARALERKNKTGVERIANARGLHEAACVHRGSRWRGGLADDGTRPAARADAAYRSAHEPRHGRSGRPDPQCG